MKILAFDIETGAAEEMHSYGPGFIRLCGWKEVGSNLPVSVSTDPGEMVQALRGANAITAHNGINFDLLALAVEGFVSHDEYEALCLKTFDTMLVEKHLNPVQAKNRQPRGYYGLDDTALRYGTPGKTKLTMDEVTTLAARLKGEKYLTVRRRNKDACRMEDSPRFKPGDEAKFKVLKFLADHYGGFDKIPQDDPDYVRYLEEDVLAQEGLFLHLSGLIKDESPESQRYVRRAHYELASLARSITLVGARVDVDLNMKRWAEGQARLDAGKQLLHDKYGMPTEGAKPHVSNPGKAAFRRAMLEHLGCSEEWLDYKWPLAKDGSLLIGKKVLDEFIPIFEKTRPEAAELCKVIKAMNGERTVYGTIQDHLVDGRVHPYIGPDQASGRWSMKNPGLTVMGKRGGKARERAVILADNDDEVLVAIDADQVDARGVAGLSQCPEYMKLFLPGVDLHSEVALRVFNRPECREEMARNNGRCDCEYRDRAKVFGHGWNYGMQPKTMANTHGVDIEVAYQFDRGMKQGFRRLAEWQSEVREMAGALAWGEEPPSNDSYRILHTGYGRPVRVERADAFTQATAMLGQGTTRDIMAEAILRLPTEYRRRVRAVIHDELVLSLPKSGAQEVAQGIADGMAMDFRGVAITFGCSRVSRSWAGCYGEQYETAA